MMDNFVALLTMDGYHNVQTSGEEYPDVPFKIAPLYKSQTLLNGLQICGQYFANPIG